MKYFKRLHWFPIDAVMETYRDQLTGEFLGWVIYSAPGSFVPVHRVHMHPTDGPVLLIGDEVYEVDENADVYGTEDEARDAYWEQKK